MVMLYEGGLKKLTTTRYPVCPVMSYSVSGTGYIVGYVVVIYIHWIQVIAVDDQTKDLYLSINRNTNTWESRKEKENEFLPKGK
jgi:hypothetical protein